MLHLAHQTDDREEYPVHEVYRELRVCCERGGGRTGEWTREGSETNSRESARYSAGRVMARAEWAYSQFGWHRRFIPVPMTF